MVLNFFQANNWLPAAVPGVAVGAGLVMLNCFLGCMMLPVFLPMTQIVVRNCSSVIDHLQGRDFAAELSA